MKVLYIDVETTGLNPDRHGIIQLAQIIEINGVMVSESVWNVMPFGDDDIDEKALQVTGTDPNSLFTEPRRRPVQVWQSIKHLWDQFIDKFNRDDKFILAGYNIDSFDQQFLRAWIAKCEPNDRFSVAGSYIGHLTMDPLPLLKWLKIMNMIDLPNLKLQTVCDHLNIKLDQAHDALADIRATRILIHRIRAAFKAWGQIMPMGWGTQSITGLLKSPCDQEPELSAASMPTSSQQVNTGDMHRDMAIHQGYVPVTCTLKGEIVMGAVNVGQDPCQGCEENRSVCKGRLHARDRRAGRSML